MLTRLLPTSATARVITLASLINTIGNGVYMTCGILYLTRPQPIGLGLTAVQLGVGLGVAATCSTLFSPAMGYLADRLGPKGTQIGVMLAMVVCYLALTVIGDVVVFLALVSVIAIGEAAIKGANGAMIAGAVPPDQRVELRGYVKSVNNAGIAIGTLIGGIPLLLDTHAAYVAMLAGNALTYLIAAAILTRATRAPVLAVPAGGSRFAALLDRPFLTFTLVDGFLASTFNQMLGIALPLWLALQAGNPVWLVTAVLLVNTLGCVTLQVWASRGADSLTAAARFGRRGAFVIGIACVLYGLAGGLPTWAVATLILAGAVVHVLGELWLSTATFTTVFGMAPDWAQGQYQGTYSMGRQVGNMLAPPMLAVVVTVGDFGWLALGAVFAAAAMVYPMVIRWGERTRPVAVALAE